MPNPPRAVTKVQLTGPFFRLDPGKVVGKNIELLLGDFAREMESEVERQIGARSGQMPFYTGHTASTIRGRVEALSGKDWRRHAVVSANTAGMGRAEAIRTKAAAASIEARWHPFSRVARAARKISRDLTKGLN